MLIFHISNCYIRKLESGYQSEATLLWILKNIFHTHIIRLLLNSEKSVCPTFVEPEFPTQSIFLFHFFSNPLTHLCKFISSLQIVVDQYFHFLFEPSSLLCLEWFMKESKKQQKIGKQRCKLIKRKTIDVDTDMWWVERWLAEWEGRGRWLGTRAQAVRELVILIFYC